MSSTSTTRTSRSLAGFRYEQLDRTKISLRLLEVSHVGSDGVLACKLSHAEIGQSYIALSYVWGPETPCHDIRLINCRNGTVGIFKIRSNLYAFLLRAVASERCARFWTDAICINQEDIPERNHQVSQMGSIYRHATEVRVWLGECSATGAMLSAMTKVSYQGDIRIIDLFDDQLCPAEHRAAFHRSNRAGLLRNEYWSRTWIVQEVLLAASIIVQSADGKTSWSNLAGFYAPQNDNQSPFMQRLLGHWRAGEILDTSDDPRRYPINFLLDTFGETKCADSRDHLYGLLALIAGGDKLVVDYTETTAQLLVRAMETLNLDAEDLRPLLPALNFDAKSLYLQSGICPSELWKTQQVLSEVHDVLDTKRVFPACSEFATSQCEWSKTGRSAPCTSCCDANNRICEMPECSRDWQEYARVLIQAEGQVPGFFSDEYMLHFKEWLCSIWPDFLDGPHSWSDDHCRKCYACDIKRGIQSKRDEWRNVERSLENSSTGHPLPSLNNWVAQQSQPTLGIRRAREPLILGKPPAGGPKLAKEATVRWAELFKDTARVEGWE